MLFQLTPTMYYLQNLQLNPSAGFRGTMPPGHPPPPTDGGHLPAGERGPPDLTALPKEFSAPFIARVSRFRRWQAPLTISSWTAIFCVKFSFLGFFRQLIRRLPSMVLYWKCVLFFTGIAYLYCATEPFISCMRPPARAGKFVHHGVYNSGPNWCHLAECGYGSARLLMVRLQGLSMFLDIFTDVLRLFSLPPASVETTSAHPCL